MVTSWKTQIWTNQKYFDVWHINHTLAGCLLGEFFLFLNVPFFYGLILAMIPMLIWEFYERARGVEETWQNGILDVIVGILGFLLVWTTFPKISLIAHLTSFAMLLSIWIFLELWGYWAYTILHNRDSVIDE